MVINKPSYILPWSGFLCADNLEDPQVQPLLTCPRDSDSGRPLTQKLLILLLLYIVYDFEYFKYN